ncbi:hypothetical protein TNCV_3681851 [Trichonephila clavipes]|uniref:Uncharacterized protein n=1 Tax=Trichonephila clavipes TaxID=2585209 RepID=A0A8X6RG36_TRICX|nr:hypothetical protein TNCV_3681851 [Trichonephila clavipes]
MRNRTKNLIFPRAPKPNTHSRGTVLLYDMDTVDFLHHENPPTLAMVEPTNLGVQGERQTNYATQQAETRLSSSQFEKFEKND